MSERDYDPAGQLLVAIHECDALSVHKILKDHPDLKHKKISTMRDSHCTGMYIQEAMEVYLRANADVKKAQEEVIRTMIRAGCDLEAKGHAKQWPALLTAADKLSPDLCRIILEEAPRQASIDVTGMGHRIGNAVHVVLDRINNNPTEENIKNGCRTIDALAQYMYGDHENTRGNGYLDAWMVIANRQRIEHKNILKMMDALLRAGADVERIDPATGSSILTRTIQSQENITDRELKLRYILACGADQSVLLASGRSVRAESEREGARDDRAVNLLCRAFNREYAGVEAQTQYMQKGWKPEQLYWRDGRGESVPTRIVRAMAEFDLLSLIFDADTLKKSRITSREAIGIAQQLMDALPERHRGCIDISALERQAGVAQPDDSALVQYLSSSQRQRD